jgi:FYVE/RhoGEF/PH domain-containing protein 3
MISPSSDGTEDKDELTNNSKDDFVEPDGDEFTTPEKRNPNDDSVLTLQFNTPESNTTVRKSLNLGSINPMSRLLSAPSWKVEKEREAKLALLHRQALQAKYKTTHYIVDKQGYWKQTESVQSEIKSVQEKYTDIGKQIASAPDIKAGNLLNRSFTKEPTKQKDDTSRQRRHQYHDDVVKKRNEQHRQNEKKREEREKREQEKIRTEEEKMTREIMVENRKHRMTEGELRGNDSGVRRKRGSSGADQDRMTDKKPSSPVGTPKDGIAYPKIAAKKRLNPQEEDKLKREKEKEEREKAKKEANSKPATPYRAPPVLFLVKQKSETSTPTKKKFITLKKKGSKADLKKKEQQEEEERELARQKALEEEEKRKSKEIELELLKQQEEEEKKRKELEEEQLKMLAKRDQVLQEIVDTERTYVKNLQELFTMYANPIKERNLLTAEQYNRVFSDLTIIKKLNEDFFNELEKVHTKITQVSTGGRRVSTPLESIGQLFKNKAPAFKLYTNYINKYETSISVLEEATEMKKAFRQFRQEVSQQLIRKGSHNIDITSFMILPVQRIPRYRILLLDVVAKTPEGHMDSEPLKEALAMIEGIAEYCNQKKSESMSSLKVVELAEELKMPDLVQPSRKLVREGRFRNEKSRSKNFRFFLFNDLVLIVQSGLMTKSHSIPLKSNNSGLSVTMTPVEGLEEAKCKMEFNAQEENYSKIFVCNNEKERDEWVSTFQTNMKGFLKRSGSIHSPMRI